MAGPSLTPTQWAILGVAYVLLFLLPAVWMWRRARKDGDAPLTWALLVAVGSILGVLEYHHHRSILKRRAKRAAAAAARKEGVATPPGDAHQGQDPPLR